MKNILILCRRDDREAYDTRKSMLDGMSKLQTKAMYFGMDYEDLVFLYDGKKLRVTDSVSGRDVADFDAIFLIGWFKTKALDDVARAVAHYAKYQGIPFSNSEAYDGRSFTKLSQCVIAALNDVPVTPFVFCMDKEVLARVIIAQQRTEPYIVKAIAESRGNSNYLVHSTDELREVLNQPSEKPLNFIAQEYIPNDGDYRILVMGESVRLVIHRQAQAGSHLNNTSKGGSAAVVLLDNLPSSVIDASLRMAKLLKREVTGVDMVCHKETAEYYFLEANNVPQLSTGSNVPKKLAVLDEYLDELAHKKVE